MLDLTGKVLATSWLDADGNSHYSHPRAEEWLKWAEGDYDGVASRTQSSIRALGMMGPLAAPAMPQIVAMFERTEVRRPTGGCDGLPRPFVDIWSLCETFKQIGPAADQAAPALIKCLATDDLSIALAIASSGVDEAVEAAISQITLAAQDKARSDEFTKEVVRALSDIGPPAVPVLLTLLASDDCRDRWMAASHLAMIPPPAEAIGPLIEALERASDRSCTHEEPFTIQGSSHECWTLTGIISALAAMGPDAAPAVPAMLRACENDAELLGTAAALVAIAPDSPEVSRRVVDAFERIEIDEHTIGACKAMVTLGHVDAGVSKLIDALSGQGTDDEDVQEMAVRLLGEIGPPAKEAMPALRSAMSSPGRSLGIGAAWAVLEVGGYDEAAVDTLIDGLTCEEYDDVVGAAAIVRRESFGAIVTLIAREDTLRPAETRWWLP